MGACRQNADLFFYALHYKYINKYFFRDILKSNYMLHDTFGKRYNRIFGCLFKHKNIQKIKDDYGNIRNYCFSCEKWI